MKSKVVTKVTQRKLENRSFRWHKRNQNSHLLVAKFKSTAVSSPYQKNTIKLKCRNQTSHLGGKLGRERKTPSKEKENPPFTQNTSTNGCCEFVKFIEFWHENLPYRLNQMQTKDWNEMETKDYCQLVDNISTKTVIKVTKSKYQNQSLRWQNQNFRSNSKPTALYWDEVRSRRSAQCKANCP